MSERLSSRMIASLRRSLQNIALRGVVTLVNSATKMQSVQVSLREGELKDSLEHFEAYGFTSNPKAGAEAVTLFFNGDRSHGIAIVIGDRRYRLQGLASGEMAIHDDQNQKVHIKRDKILIETPLDIEMRGNNVRIHGNASLILECNGHGEKWLPTHKESWTIGSTGASYAINPPQIP
ncbi:phage baseplate assembly protein V [Methylotenera oryzisoli]|nr:phage baseplate assembly protein V [Methylotenera oryzisoli]